MKKILALIMAVAMLLSIAACENGGEGGNTTSTEEQTTTTSLPAEEPSSSEISSDISSESSSEPESSFSEAATSSKPKKDDEDEHSHNIPRYTQESFGYHELIGWKDCKVSSHYIQHTGRRKCVDEDDNYRCDECGQHLLLFSLQFDSNGTTGVVQFRYGIEGLPEPTYFVFYINDELVYRGTENRHNFAEYLTEPGEYVLYAGVCDEDGNPLAITMATCTVYAKETEQ